MKSFLHRMTLLVLGGCLVGAAQADERPNFLVIAIDDLRPDLACYGGQAITPHLDSLANRGVLFKRAYCQQAVCGPSRSSVFSGCRPDTLQAHNNRTHFRSWWPDLVSLPEHFKNHGYRTRGIGKILHNTHTDPRSWTNGDFYPVDPQYAAPDNAGRRALIDGLHPENRDNPLFESARVEDEAYRDGLIAASAVQSLRDLSAAGKPFFLMVGFHKPHTPFNAPKTYWDLYDRGKIRLAPNPFPPGNGLPFTINPSRYLRSFQDIPATGPFPDTLAREITHAYLACVSYIDAQVGRLLVAMKQVGLDRNTVVVVWSDHGYQLGHHTMWCKHTNFETSTRVPFLVSDPRQPMAHGRRVGTPVELVDLYPTLAELGGLPLPEHLEGRSLAGLMNAGGVNAEEDRVAFSQFNAGGYHGKSMRTPDFRLIRWEHPRTGEVLMELYDHRMDPGEDRNVAGDTEYAKVLAELEERLEREWPKARQSPLEKPDSGAQGLLDKIRS